MKVLVNNKNVNIPDEVINNYVNKLELTEQEAIQTYLEEEGYLENQEVEELSKKAKVNKTDKLVVQSKATKTKTERKPKENPLKQAIIQDLYDFLAKNNTLLNVTIANNTKTIDFIAEGKHFSLNLVEHRAKK